MIGLLQRVTQACVDIGGSMVGAIGPGLMLLSREPDRDLLCPGTGRTLSVLPYQALV